MKTWLLFVVGGFTGVIGYLLLWAYLQIAYIGNFLGYSERDYFICIFVWIIGGFSSLLAPRWENQRSRLIAMMFISLVVGVISGFLIWAFWALLTMV